MARVYPVRDGGVVLERHKSVAAAAARSTAERPLHAGRLHPTLGGCNSAGLRLYRPPGFRRRGGRSISRTQGEFPFPPPFRGAPPFPLARVGHPSPTPPLPY